MFFLALLGSIGIVCAGVAILLGGLGIISGMKHAYSDAFYWMPFACMFIGIGIYSICLCLKWRKQEKGEQNGKT